MKPNKRTTENMKTIRSNSKAFTEAKKNTNWVCYSLRNNFKAEAFGSIENQESGKMTEDEKTVTFSVHSNLWFELSK